ncbi:BPTI/Kunitz domain-containing protein [Ekhidna sp.]|jgi:hypothetical protein|uniref:BPTI/Kunitz domain-containing protein n=1 Tax=Ekhidna sp. TaxID=2608089 RepID=UPI0032EDA56C
MILRLLVGFSVLAIVLGCYSPDEVTVLNETWVLTELREKSSKNVVQIPSEEYVELSFHGDKCITINTKCSSNSGIYLRETGTIEVIVVRAMLEIDSKCSTDFFGDEVERFSDAIVISRRENNLLEIISDRYLLIFTRGDSSIPLNCIDQCSLVPNGGVCRALFRKYYFDQDEQRCKQFNWGGCSGTVPFETLEECQSKCGD